MGRVYKRVTEGLDPERGNAFTIYREDVAPLVRQLPTEVTAPIFDAFIRWFCNVAEPELKDAIAKAIEEQLKERQREAVKIYKSVCDARRHSGTKEPDGETQVETSIDKPLNKEKKVKNEVNEVNTSVLYGGEAATTDGLPPSASPSSSTHGTGIGKEDIIEARKVLARFAPAPKFVLAFDDQKLKEPCIADWDDDDHNIDERAKRSMDKVKDCYLKLEDGREWDEEDCWLQVSRSAYSHYGEGWDRNDVARSLIGDAYNDSLRAAWRKYHDTLGDTTFLNAVWTFLIAGWTDNLPANDKDDNKTNKGKLLFGRLKKLVEAKAILDQYDDHRRAK